MSELTPEDRDLIARTALSEAAEDGPPGVEAATAVIRNRVRSGRFGDSPSAVVLSRNAFEPWSLPRSDPNHPSRWAVNSPEYRRATKIVDQIWNSPDDPTNGATHFFSPSVQAEMGRSVPKWAQTKPTATIGHHVFFAPEGTVGPDLLGSWGAAQPVAPAGAPAAPATAANPPAGGTDLLGAWKVAAPISGAPAPNPTAPAAPVAAPAAAPVAVTSPASVPSAAPAIAAQDEALPQFINRLVTEHQGNSLTDRAIRLGAGVGRGVGDVADTLAQGIAAAGRGGANVLQSAGVIAPETAKTVQDWAAGVNQNVIADRNAFDHAAATSPLAQAGRIGGQLLGTAPLLGAGGALIDGATGIGTGLASRPVMNALVTGAAGGAGASALTSAASDQPFLDQATQGLLAGGVLGPLGHGASRLGANIFGAVSPETAALARTARDTYGIPVTAGQISETPAVRFADSVLQRLPLTGYGARTAEQRGAFNRAVSNEFGEDTPTISMETIKNAKDRIGNVFDSVAARTGAIHADPQFGSDVLRIVRDAKKVLPESEIRPLAGQVSDLMSAIDPATHTFSGQTYQALTRKGAPLDRAMQSKDPNIRHYAGQLRDAIDDAMQRSAPPEVVQDLIEARRQWKALKTVEPLVKKATTGDISPALLLNKVNASYSGDGGRLGELGRIGQRFIKEPPSSGTAERLLTMQLGKTALAGLGLGGAYAFDPENFQRNALLGGGALLGGRAGSALLRSNALTNALIRSGLRAPGAGNPLANLLTRTAPAGALAARSPLFLPPAGPATNSLAGQ